MKEIKSRFLILQAIAIILVVIGHRAAVGIEELDWFRISSYHMAIFIFISGYFFKSNNLDNIPQYILGKIKRLVIPYFIYNLIYGIIITYLRYKNIVSFGQDLSLKTFFIDGWIHGHQYVLNLATWFVLSLFLTQTTFILIRYVYLKYKLNNEFALFIFFLLLGLISILISNITVNTIPIYLPFLRIMFFLPFFHFGFYYKTKLEEKDKLKDYWYWTS